MKTLKFLILICIVAGFSVGTAKSQVQRWVNTETYHETSIWFGCIDEPLTGDMVWTYTYTWKEDNGFLKLQEKYKGTLTGDISGDIYTISLVANDHSVSMVNVNGHWTGNWYYVQTFTIEKDGIPVSTYHRLIHGTGNTNSFENKGAWAAYVDNEWFECF